MTELPNIKVAEIEYGEPRVPILELLDSLML